MRWMIVTVVLAAAALAAAQVTEAPAGVEGQVEEASADVQGQVAEAPADAEGQVTEAQSEKPPVDAYAEAADIMDHLCMECHGDYKPDAGFHLPTTREGQGMVGVPSSQRTDLLLIDTGEPAKSYLIMKLENDPGILGRRMPIARELTDEQIHMFELWVYGLAEVNPVETAGDEAVAEPEGEADGQEPGGESDSGVAPRAGEAGDETRNAADDGDVPGDTAAPGDQGTANSDDVTE